MTQPLDVLGGLDDSAAYKVPCAAATTADMTNTMIGLPIIDGYQTLSGDRVLVWQNTDQTTNGIYNVGTAAWTRAVDFSNSGSYVVGTQVLIINGTEYAGQIFVVDETSPNIVFSLSVLAFAAETAAAQASASAAAAAASASAAAAAAAGSGGSQTINVTGGTLVLSPAQSSAAALTFTGTLTAHQFVDFPANATNSQLVVIDQCVHGGFNLYLRGGAGADTIGVWWSQAWVLPLSVKVTPARVYWGGYEAVPPGSTQDYPVGFTAPPGWLVCDGSNYDGTIYDLLFGVIKQTFGGSGSNFNVPDDRGIALAGADNMGTGVGSAGRLNNWTVATTGGEAAHTLTIAEMPSHNHTDLALSATPGTAGAAAQDLPQTGGMTGLTGGGGAHNNVQPTRTTLRIIRF